MYYFVHFDTENCGLNLVFELAKPPTMAVVNRPVVFKELSKKPKQTQ